MFYVYLGPHGSFTVSLTTAFVDAEIQRKADRSQLFSAGVRAPRRVLPLQDLLSFNAHSPLPPSEVGFLTGNGVNCAQRKGKRAAAVMLQKKPRWPLGGG